MALQDSIQNILALMQIMGQQRQGQAQLDLQRKQLASQQATQRATSQNDLLINLLPALRSMPNSEAAGPFFESIAGRVGLDPEFLMNFAQSIAPTLEAQTSGAARTGRATAAPERVAAQNEAAADQVTGYNPLQAGIQRFILDGLNSVEGDPGVTRAAVLRQLTGMAPGEFALSQATAGLPAGDLTGAARVGLDLQVGAGGQLSAATAMRGQDLGYASSMAGNRLGWAQLAQQGQLGMLELQVRQQLGQLNAAGQNSLGPNDLPELGRLAETLTQQLEKANTPVARQQYAAILNGVNGIISGQFGIPTPQINLLEDYDKYSPQWLRRDNAMQPLPMNPPPYSRGFLNTPPLDYTRTPIAPMGTMGPYRPPQPQQQPYYPWRR